MQEGKSSTQDNKSHSAKNEAVNSLIIELRILGLKSELYLFLVIKHKICDWSKIFYS